MLEEKQVDYRLIGRRIQELRTRRSMSQVELAERSGLSVTHVSYVENAKKKPGLEVLVCMASALDTTADDLLAGNQRNEGRWSDAEIGAVVEGCTAYERCVLIQLLTAAKSILRENSHLLTKD